MTDDTTTIEITEWQRDELKELKAHDRESYKAVMDRLLDKPVIEDRTHERFKELKTELDDRQDGVPDHTADSFVSALLDTWEAAGRDYHTSNDHTVELGELQEQLDRIESATKEATNAAQSADRKLENMGGR